MLAEKFDGGDHVADGLVAAGRKVDSVKSMLQFDLEVFFTVARGKFGDFLMEEQADQRVVRTGEFFNSHQVVGRWNFLLRGRAECCEVVDSSLFVFMQLVKRLFAFYLDEFRLRSVFQAFLDRSAVEPVLVGMIVDEFLLLGQLSQSVADFRSKPLRRW